MDANVAASPSLNLCHLELTPLKRVFVSASVRPFSEAVANQALVAKTLSTIKDHWNQPDDVFHDVSFCANCSPT